jgi:hypothetical protein
MEEVKNLRENRRKGDRRVPSFWGIEVNHEGVRTFLPAWEICTLE